MNTAVYGTGTDLVFVLGWGNQPEHETVRWLIDRLVEAGYRVHAIEIPTTITDFDAEYRQPVAEYVATLSSYRLLTHSTGGLIGAFLSGPKTRVYLSPWWGMHEDQDGLLARLFARLPIARPLFPTGIDAEAIGTLASGEQLADAPDAVSPTFLREIRRAQAALPPFRPDSVVFFSPDDRVVSPTAIQARAPAENRVPYDGGHELFSSSDREALATEVVDAVDEVV